MPVFVRASRRAKAYVRGGFNKINKQHLRKARIAGTMTISSPEAGRNQLQRYSLQNKLPRKSVQARRLTTRKRLHAKAMYNS